MGRSLSHRRQGTEGNARRLSSSRPCPSAQRGAQDHPRSSAWRRSGGHQEAARIIGASDTFDRLSAFTLSAMRVQEQTLARPGRLLGLTAPAKGQTDDLSAFAVIPGSAVDFWGQKAVRKRDVIALTDAIIDRGSPVAANRILLRSSLPFHGLSSGASSRERKIRLH